MDPVQHRLATDFALDKKRYVYKQGESDPKGDEGCDIVEATQALACANSAALTVQVKREIGALWADTTRPPYTDLFNENLTSMTVWRAVLIMRAVDEELQKLKLTQVFSADLIAVHLNRLILHLGLHAQGWNRLSAVNRILVSRASVFQNPALRALRHDNSDELVCLVAVREVTHKIFPKVAAYIEKEHPDNYLASFSKNSTKCEKLVKVLLGIEDAGRRQGTLF